MMKPDLERRSARFCFAFLTLLVLSFSSIYSYYRFVDQRLLFDPYQLSLFDYQKKQALRLDKADPLCQELLREAYCQDYCNYIMSHDVYLAHQRGGIALPNLQARGGIYMLHENSELRFELWKHRAPQVVLLGSSMMFQNFHRPTFFERYPDLRLLDFTVSYNTPECAKHLLEQLSARRCEIPPGTVFLYGINVVEMTSWYPSSGYSFTLDCMESIPGWFGRQLLLLQSAHKNLKSLAWNQYKESTLPAEKPTSARPYLFEVSNELARDPGKLKAWLYQLETPPNIQEETSVPFDDKRLNALKWIAQWVEQKQGKLVLIKVPTSSFSRHISQQVHRDFDVRIDPVVRELEVAYFALDDHEKLGINETHFVYPGNLFNPDHLNYEGSKIFTTYLLNQLNQQWISPIQPAHLQTVERSIPQRESSSPD